MTTRGLFGFRIEDTDKLAYNHTDSTPDMLGLRILNELRAVDDWDIVRQRIDDLHTLPEERLLGEHTSMAEAEVRRHFPNLECRVAPRNIYDLYQPLQGTLRPYLNGELMFMPNASDFIHNSLHCSWAYIINLDTEEFEVWKGNQREPDSEDNRLVAEPNRYGTEPDRMGYYPCAMVKQYDLSDLPNHGLFLTYYSFAGDIER